MFMCEPTFEVQTRNARGELQFFSTLDAAFHHAEEDPTVWKISFPVTTNERVRLVKGADGKWVYENIMDEVLKTLEKEGEL